jgi:hypothetical protein
MLRRSPVTLPVLRADCKRLGPRLKTQQRSKGPQQVFAAPVAQARGYDVDKPRNLATSVTVE